MGNCNEISLGALGMCTLGTSTSDRPKRTLPTLVMRSLIIMQTLATTSVVLLFWSGDRNPNTMHGLINLPTEFTAWPISLTMLQRFFDPRCTLELT